MHVAVLCVVVCVYMNWELTHACCCFVCCSVCVHELGMLE